jgi:hypothetical protein
LGVDSCGGVASPADSCADADVFLAGADNDGRGEYQHQPAYGLLIRLAGTAEVGGFGGNEGSGELG